MLPPEGRSNCVVLWMLGNQPLSEARQAQPSVGAAPVWAETGSASSNVSPAAAASVIFCACFIFVAPKLLGILRSIIALRRRYDIHIAPNGTSICHSPL